MSDSSTSPSVQPKRRGLAIASLIIGIVGTVTCGIFGAGAIAGVIIGAMALSKANKNPAIYGGKGLSIAGIVVSAMSPSPGIVAAVAVPNLIRPVVHSSLPMPAPQDLLESQQAHEAAAIETVKEIGRAQVIYSVTEGRGKFGDMAALVASALIDRNLAADSGYIFSTTPVNIGGMPPMFDTTARPIITGRFGTANRSFASNETLVIYVADGSVELRGTPDNREPVGGTPLNDQGDQPRLIPCPSIRGQR